MPEVILPVLDEAGAIPEVLGRLPAGYEAIVVDNGSSDGSAEIAAGLGARVVSEPRRGFGAACHAGLEAATGEFVCMMDCDGSLDPGELPRLLALLEQGEADLALGAGGPCGAPGRPMPGSRTSASRPCCAEGRASRFTTWGRCGPHAASSCWASG